jgi:flagellin-like hook-associated protein FlgL
VAYADTGSATDVVDGALTASCSPASPQTFSVGTHTITCTATDSHSNEGSATFTVTVNAAPNTPPTLILPGDITREATGPTTPVTFTVTATDLEDNPDPTPTCSPTSGSAFPIGTTTVNCSVTDSSGASDSGSFDVTVQDTTPPTVTPPANVVASATGPTGAVVSYGTATATDLVDGSLPAECDPLSGSLFPLGTTAVDCTSTDDAGNTGTASFTVTVQDAGAPVVDVPDNVTVEATGPAGATVNYGTVTATDDVDGPLTGVTCSKASGTVFPIAQTSVTCSATDSQGNTGSGTFFVTVRDTTPPVVTPPADIAIKSATPIPATDGVIEAFLNGASAADLVDEAPQISNDAPDTFELGFTTVTFTARDDHGNAATATAKVEVGPNPSPPDAVDRVPPGNIKKLAALAGNRSYLFRWANPKAEDFAYVEVTRSPGKNGDEDSSVYRGTRTTFRDKGLAEGEQYRYLFVSYDEAGNRSVGVAIVVLGKTQLLLAPLNGATVVRPPKLAWRRVPNTTVHNLQLYFVGSSTTAARSTTARTFKKVLSVFPKATSYQLRSGWTYAGHRYRLTKGCYAWYVWPYLSTGKYGKLLGESEFCYKPKAKKKR